MRSAPTLACELVRSRIELAAIGALTLAALAAPWAAPIGMGARIALSAGALSATAAALSGWRRRPWVALSFGDEGRVVLRRADASEWPGRLREATLLGPLVVVALEGEGGGRLYLPLYPDSTDPDSLRHIRVLLRHGRRAEPGGAIR
jgi:hypothetical protein